MRTLTLTLTIAAAACLAVANSAEAQTSATEGRWRVTISPYPLIPSMSGTSGIGDLTTQVDAGPDDMGRAARRRALEHPRGPGGDRRRPVAQRVAVRGSARPAFSRPYGVYQIGDV